MARIDISNGFQSIRNADIIIRSESELDDVTFLNDNALLSSFF